MLAHIEQHVLGVGGHLLGVDVVWSSLLDLVEEVLLDVELADMRDGAALDGVVGKKGSTMVHDGCKRQKRLMRQQMIEAYCASDLCVQRSDRG